MAASSRPPSPSIPFLPAMRSVALPVLEGTSTQEKLESILKQLAENERRLAEIVSSTDSSQKEIELLAQQAKQQEKKLAAAEKEQESKHSQLKALLEDRLKAAKKETEDLLDEVARDAFSTLLESARSFPAESN
jgi:septal ring factor EnvC (AmiA/AmiB activator)